MRKKAFIIEKVGEGRFDVFWALDDPPRRIGHVIGGNRSWLAEFGNRELGYYRTRKGAVMAIMSTFGK